MYDVALPIRRIFGSIPNGFGSNFPLSVLRNTWTNSTDNSERNLFQLGFYVQIIVFPTTFSSLCCVFSIFVFVLHVSYPVLLWPTFYLIRFSLYVYFFVSLTLNNFTSLLPFVNVQNLLLFLSFLLGINNLFYAFLWQQ